jgi:SAM-dependent methyltransferase
MDKTFIKAAAKAVLPPSSRAWILARKPFVDRLSFSFTRRWSRFRSLRRLKPVRPSFGWGYGQCIDRYYIENFLLRHAADVYGRVLELSDNTYTRRYGGQRVVRSDVLYAVPDPQATIVADLASPDHTIPSQIFDCIILTQTLELIYDVRAALRTLYRILKPGGVLLATFPGIRNISRWDMEHWGEHWRFTTLSASKLFNEVFPEENVTVEAFGNVLTTVAFLHGLVTEELRQKELDYHDPDYEMLIVVRAVKPLD